MLNQLIEAYRIFQSLDVFMEIAPSMQDKFVSELEVIIRKKSSKKMTIEEQWVSEKEMKDDLKWSA